MLNVVDFDKKKTKNYRFCLSTLGGILIGGILSYSKSSYFRGKGGFCVGGLCPGFDFHKTWQQYVNHCPHESIRNKILNGLYFSTKQILGHHFGSLGQLLGVRHQKNARQGKARLWHVLCPKHICCADMYFVVIS